MMIIDDHIAHRLTRRTLLGATGSAILATNQLRSSASAAVRQNAPVGPSGWKTWYLASPDELRPADPGAPSQAEIDEVIAAQAAPTDATIAAIARWGGRVSVLPLNDVASAAFIEFKTAPLLVGRAESLLQTAMSDAALAAWDAQVTFARPSPGATSDKVTPGAGVDPKQSSFPSEHAAIAAAAAAVLTYV